MGEDQLTCDLLAFIRTEFLDGDANGELTEDTPLLAWGVLDSFKTARLLGFIEDELGSQIPPEQLYAGNFRDVRSIAAMVRATGGQPTRQAT
ncbi:acyl carrier protein [Plantactinospora siamensis]|uniref:Acyl carrier protein n=1 Tax=Plantactinospora siamensis TaxID=555372 RepID=A0ABV6P4G8_9ACTN